MADRRRGAKSGPYHVRIASGKLFLPSDVASRIENMRPTEEGTLRSVSGPIPYVPNPTTGGAPASGATPQTLAAVFSYGNVMRGIFHCILRGGQREILLLHTLDQVWSFQGWNHRNDPVSAWQFLLGNGISPSPRIPSPLTKDASPQFPTQFVATPRGVVIVPQNSRAYYYDGETVLPLGYATRPAPPIGLGPTSTGYRSPTNVDGEAIATTVGWVNNVGYAHDALPGFDTQMFIGFKTGRIGTTVQSGGTTAWEETVGADAFVEMTGDSGAGWLEPGAWRYAVQFVDRWGNLSPLSGRSAEVRVQRQPSYWVETYDGSYKYGPAQVESVRKHLACASIPLGPLGTVGRILYRTKDLVNSGSVDLYEVPLNATESADTFATIPDNVVKVFPDNIPDFWLVRQPLEPVPVGEFKLAALAFGSLWTANFKDSPGKLHPSMVGRWGTFLRDQEIFPDPSGGEITGLLTVPGALLVFTVTSTYRIEPYYDSPGFRSMSLSQSVGCVAPSSCAVLGDGRAIWLDRDGFYTYAGTAIKYVSEDLSEGWKQHNRARGKQAVATVTAEGLYRCWVAVESSRENNRCYEYNGVGWRTRTDLAAGGVCTTKDHRGYTLVAGKHDTNYGVWLLDHQTQSYQPTATTTREARVETSWLSAATSQIRKTTYQVELWFIEHGSSDITVEVQRDWRNTILETHAVPKNPTDDPPPFWGTAVLDAADTVWRRRRPYWRRVHVYVPSSEVFRLVIRGAGKWEFIGLQFDEVAHHTGGSRTPP